MQKKGIFTLDKQERLCSKKTVDRLFNGGGSHSMVAFPVRMVYAATAGGEQTAAPAAAQDAGAQDVRVQLLVSVPKKRFKHAVDRNRVKRQLREAFRQHKQILYNMYAEHPALPSVALAFIWTDSHHHPSALVDQRVASLLQRMAEKIQRAAAKEQAAKEQGEDPGRA